MKGFNKKELAWVARLQRVMDSAPKSLSMFCEGGDINIFKSEKIPRDEWGDVDSEFPYKESVNVKIDYDAGAW